MHPLVSYFYRETTIGSDKVLDSKTRISPLEDTAVKRTCSPSSSSVLLLTRKQNSTHEKQMIDES